MREKGQKGIKKEGKGTNGEKKGGKFGKFLKMNGTIYIPVLSFDVFLINQQNIFTY